MPFLFDKLFQKQNPELASAMAKRGLIFDRIRHRWIRKPENRAQPTYGAKILGYTSSYDKKPGLLEGPPSSEATPKPKSESIKHNLDKYVDMITDLLAEYWTRNSYTHSPAPTAKIHNVGERFARISIAEDGKSVSLHSWIDMKTGDIIKGSWKAPIRTKKGLAIRGNILSADLGRSKIDYHGPKYLR